MFVPDKRGRCGLNFSSNPDADTAGKDKTTFEWKPWGTSQGFSQNIQITQCAQKSNQNSPVRQIEPRSLRVPGASDRLPKIERLSLLRASRAWGGDCMKFENICSIGAPCPTIWDYVTDIPKVAQCLPGVEEVRALEEGKYGGALSLKVGAVKLRLAGKISIERMDQEKHAATMSFEAADQKISGMVRGSLTLQLDGQGPAQTKLTVGTDLNLFGKIGEFGRAVIKKKADQMMEQFARNLATSIGSSLITAPPSFLNLS
jgi:carbon monoxide dehydrogenase subunit G